MKINPIIIRSILLLVALLSLFVLPGQKIPYVDKKADAYFSEAITKAGVAYGVCRLVNASVSIIKESQVQLEPAGLGVSLAAGQVLDPLDDMTERASVILVTSIVSLGVQKVAFELCIAFVPILIGLAILVFLCASFVQSDRAAVLRRMVIGSIVLLAAARLCLPVSSIINAYLYENYFSPRIIAAKDGLAMGSPQVEHLGDLSMPRAEGVLETVKSGFDFVGKKTSDLGAALKVMIKNMKSMVANLLKLSYLYGALFLVQVILLPAGAFWLLARMANILLGR